MTCKDCLHYEAHKHFFSGKDYEKGFDDVFNGKFVEIQCPEFSPYKLNKGGTVYQIGTDGRIYESKIREIIYETDSGIAFDERAIGTSIFLSREEVDRHIKTYGIK